MNEQNFKQKHAEGYSDDQLAEYFKVGLSTIKVWRKKLNLNINKKSRILQFDNFTENEFQVLYGTILGDSHLSNKRANITGSMAHCKELKNFIEFKHKYLKRFTSPIQKKIVFDYRFKNPLYALYYMYIKSSVALNNLYPFVYKNKVKYINKDVLYKLTGLGIATWYMDDGSNCKYGYLLCTQGFNYNDCLLILLFFKEKYNINTSIRKDNSIYIKADSKLIFKNLVYPYMDKSMLYKL